MSKCLIERDMRVGTAQGPGKPGTRGGQRLETHPLERPRAPDIPRVGHHETSGLVQATERRHLVLCPFPGGRPPIPPVLLIHARPFASADGVPTLLSSCSGPAAGRMRTIARTVRRGFALHPRCNMRTARGSDAAFETGRERQFWRSRCVATTPDQAKGGPFIRYFTPPAVRPATIRRWKISTATRSGTVTITPAAMIVPYGVSKPVCR